MHIEKALRLAGRPATSQSQTPRGRAKRIREIEEALSGKDVSSQTAQMNVPDAKGSKKRSSHPSPESSPNPKRRYLPPSSPDPWPLLSPTDSSVSSSEFFSGSPYPSETTTSEPEHSSPGPEPNELPTKVRICDTRTMNSDPYSVVEDLFNATDTTIERRFSPGTVLRAIS